MLILHLRCTWLKIHSSWPPRSATINPASSQTSTPDGLNPFRSRSFQRPCREAGPCSFCGGGRRGDGPDAKRAWGVSSWTSGPNAHRLAWSAACPRSQAYSATTQWRADPRGRSSAAGPALGLLQPRRCREGQAVGAEVRVPRYFPFEHVAASPRPWRCNLMRGCGATALRKLPLLARRHTRASTTRVGALLPSWGVVTPRTIRSRHVRPS